MTYYSSLTPVSPVVTTTATPGLATYTPPNVYVTPKPKEESSNSGLLLGLFILGAAVVIGILYFATHRSAPVPHDVTHEVYVSPEEPQHEPEIVPYPVPTPYPYNYNRPYPYPYPYHPYSPYRPYPPNHPYPPNRPYPPNPDRPTILPVMHTV